MEDDLQKKKWKTTSKKWKTTSKKKNGRQTQKNNGREITNFLAPRSSLSGRIQIGHKSGFIIYFIIIIIMSSVNIKPTRHRFGFSLAWDWQ